MTKQEIIKENEEMQREYKEYWLENYNEERDYFVFECDDLDDCYAILEQIPYCGFLIDNDGCCHIQHFDDSDDCVDVFTYDVNEETFKVTVWLLLI